jgi:hypothetical protein
MSMPPLSLEALEGREIVERAREEGGIKEMWGVEM